MKTKGKTMKYRIEVYEYEDGSEQFNPQVKKHWWSTWWSLDYKGSEEPFRILMNREDADLAIERHKKGHRKVKKISTIER